MGRIVKGYVETPAGQVHYRATLKERDAPPLVLFHQTASSSAMYEPLMRELADDFWMFAPDTPGFGGTFFPPGRPTVAYYADVLYDSLQAMGIAEGVVFGHHTGASIAVQMVYDHPALARKMVLSGPPHLTPSEREVRKADVHATLIKPDGSHLLETWERLGSKETAAPLALIHRETVLALHAGERYHEAYLAVFEHDFAGQLPAIDCPMLLLAGEIDTLRPYLEPAYAAARQASMRVIPGVGSLICDLEPRLLAGLLREFFRGGEDRKSQTDE